VDRVGLEDAPAPTMATNRSRRTRQEDRKGDPNVAALLTWFVPGAGHAYLGLHARALAGFAAIAGLYAVGLRLCGGMTFQYLDPELRTRFAPALSPETGFLGAFLYQVQHYGYGAGVDLWPSWMVIGSLMCALAGIANIVFMVQAHWDAQGHPRVSGLAQHPARAVALAWVLPGLAHFLQGRRVRAAIVFGLLVGLFALGTVLADGSNLSRERHFYYWSGQIMVGLPAVVGELMGKGLRLDHQLAVGDAGLVFACVAGLLNVLAMIDAYAFAEARIVEPDAERDPPAKPAATR